MPSRLDQDPDIDLKRIAKRGSSRSWAFEELCCQLAAHDGGTERATFRRLRGDGGDGGVECLWTFPDGETWGWQAKYVFTLKSATPQLRRSFESAIANHPTLMRYVMCLPFDITPAEVKAFRSFKESLERRAAEADMALRIDLWDAASITDRLLAIDPHGGRRRYWFDANAFGDGWFAERLEDARRRAGPRYTPEIHQETPIVEVLAALGGDEQWVEALQARVREAADLQRMWARTLTASTDPSIPQFPDGALPAGRLLERELDALSRGLNDAANGAVPPRDAATVIEAAHHCLRLLEQDLDGRHGRGASASADFRQRAAEMSVRFPAIHVDRCRQVLAFVDQLHQWLLGPAPRAASERVLVVTGAAGAGKTHGVLDVARSRMRAGIPSVLVFGDQLLPRAPLGPQLAGALGLAPATWSSDALLDALDAAGRVAGRPLILFLDALNESEDRSGWRDSLPVLVAHVQQRPNLRLCVTCRTAYLSQVVRPDLDLPRFEHLGFGGREFDACAAFFAHYGLEPPVGPLLHPEFSNPLFLKLACKKLKDQGARRLPAGGTGIQQVLTAILADQDEKVALAFPEVDRHVVRRALVDLASEMDNRGVRALAWSDADGIVARLLGSQAPNVGLLRTLEAADLLIRAPGPEVPGGFAPPEDRVSIAFDRMRDHLLALAAIRGADVGQRALGAPTRQHVMDAARDPGVAGALALLLPEQFDLELLDLFDDEHDRHEQVSPWLDALGWRTPGSITARTVALVDAAMAEPDHEDAVLDALLTLTVRPGHPLDADALHATLARLPMPERDAVWCPYLHRAFDRRDAATTSPVCRLLDAAWSDGVGGVDDEVARGWLVALCWFFAAADRRVRDHATKAAVRVSESRPQVWAKLLHDFIDVDDDYVVERVLAAAYGTLLRTRDIGAAGAAAEVIAARLFHDRARHRPHALLRDHARCIGELAHELGALPVGVSVDVFLPPYESAWPLRVPAPADLERYRSPESRQRYPRLLQSCLGEIGGDFGIYTVDGELRAHGHAMSVPDARRWIFQCVLDLGYTPARFARYDHDMLARFGGGRGRPGWAERIGKKYQRIALNRLLGHVTDAEAAITAPRVGPHHPRGLTAEGQRDLDPSLLVQRPLASDTAGWWSPPSPDFDAVAHLDDAAWVALDDFPSPKADVLLPRPDPAAPDRTWLLLSGHFSFADPAPGDRSGPRRDMWVRVEAFLLPRRYARAAWATLQRADFWGQWMPTSTAHGFVGAYPTAADFDVSEDAAWPPDERMPFPLEPACTTLDSHFEGDAWQEEVIHVHLPSRTLVAWSGARWDGRASFLAPDGAPVFKDPALEAPGPGCLLADAARLRALLREHDHVLIWSYVAERRVSSTSFRDEDYAGSKHLSYAAMWVDEERVRVSRTPVGEHDLPGGEVIRLGGPRGGGG